MTYIWFLSDRYPQKMIGIYDDKASPNRYLFAQGLLIKENPGKVVIRLPKITKDQVSKFNNIENSAGLPLVDKKIREILDDLAEFDVQYFDAIVECKDGIIEDYSIVNATNAVMAVDHTRAQYSYFSDSTDIRRFQHLAFQPHCLGNHLLARNKEFRSHLLVSRLLVEAFKKNKITGIHCITTDEYNAIGPI
ncbi:MAG: hypothetical protein H2069_00635 [Legionella sp.]|nr:hypothetical protein [Legionella sp.]